jgi:hypothetical protein
MDITTLAAWGEFLGGIAVVVSLVYLASQIRQNSKLLRVSTASATSATNADFSSLVVQDSEVARIFREGMTDRSSLSEDDMQRFDALLMMGLTANSQEYQFFVDGVMARSIWENRTLSLRRILLLPGYRQWWTEWGDMYPEEFRNVIDGLIREGEAAGPTSPVS